MRYIYFLLTMIVMSVGVSSCIEDGYTTDPNAQPTFSTDTLKMGSFFTDDITPTYAFRVYNRHDKLISISSIRLRDGGKGYFRLNVDGMSGTEFTNVDVRPNDSIFVFVEAKIPVNGSPLPMDLEDKLDFVTNGVSQTVVLTATGQDVTRHYGERIETDTHWTADLPHRIYDSLVVAKGATLTLDPGVKLYFHDKALLKVDGTLVTLGTPDNVVEMSGDRTDNVVGSIPFDLMSGQWGGVWFTSSSKDNKMSHTVIRNTNYGVFVDSIPSSQSSRALYMLNCRLRNSAGYALEVHHSDVTAIGCEIADASAGVMLLRGGNLRFNHCTIANYYLFTALGGPAVQFVHFSPESDDGSGMPFMNADFVNCIIYGNGIDLNCGDFTGADVTLRRCILKSNGSDDNNFLDCLWDTDPLYYTVREDYLFDYRLKDDSPGIAAGWGALTDPAATKDFYGLSRGSNPDIGAYVYTPGEK